MRLHRFFIEEHLRNKKDITLYDDDVIHQWKNVFRLRTGDRVILLDNSGYEYLSEIGLLAKGKAELKIIEVNISSNSIQKDIWLLQSLIKKDNFEWVIEKGTELGVARFIPILSERSEKKDLNMERSGKILKEASEQSGRGKLSEIEEVMSLESAIDFAANARMSLVAFHLDGQPFNKQKIGDKAGVLIGPEGGWSPEEIELFKNKGVDIYSLGSQVLRAETAAIAAASLLLL